MNNWPTRIIFAINDFLYGGAQRLYLDLFAALDPQEFEMHLVTLMDFPDHRDLFKEVPAYVHIHRFHFQGIQDMREWWRLARKLREIKATVVISSLFFTNAILRIFKPLMGYRVIAIEHNTYEKKIRLHILIDRILSHMTYAIVAVSETVRTFTAKQEHIPLEKFRVIRNGIDIKRIHREFAMVDREAVRHKLGLDPTDKITINVGRLTAQKNQGALIEAFAQFSKKHPEYKLIILGEGKMRGVYERLIADLHAQRCVKLLGVRDNVVAFYAIVDFFVSSSHIEGFGIAHAEALACGLPVLTTKTAGPDEMIREGENGYFIESSVEGIEAGLEQMANSELAPIRASALESAKKYDVKNTIHAYQGLIREIREILDAK